MGYFVVYKQVMIPLSLYVTVECTKMLQVFHINNNIDLYDPLTDKRVECRALNITEELGQVIKPSFFIYTVQSLLSIIL